MHDERPLALSATRMSMGVSGLAISNCWRRELQCVHRDAHGLPFTVVVCAVVRSFTRDDARVNTRNSNQRICVGRLVEISNALAAVG